MNFDLYFLYIIFLDHHLMLIDYSNQFNIPTKIYYSRQEQRGDKSLKQTFIGQKQVDVEVEQGQYYFSEVDRIYKSLLSSGI